MPPNPPTPSALVLSHPVLSSWRRHWMKSSRLPTSVLNASFTQPNLPIGANCRNKKPQQALCIIDRLLSRQNMVRIHTRVACKVLIIFGFSGMYSDVFQTIYAVAKTCFHQKNCKVYVQNAMTKVYAGLLVNYITHFELFIQGIRTFLQSEIVRFPLFNNSLIYNFLNTFQG